MIQEGDFYEFVYKTFYGFADVKPEDVGLVFSKDSRYPLIESIHDPVMVMPIPKLVDDKYVYEGMVFENTPERRRDMWFLFLATLYHLSAHASVTSYSKYDKWRKNKTAETCWQVIDFIEDISADRYLYHKDKDVWKNIHEIETKILNEQNTGSKSQKEKQKRFQDTTENVQISNIRNEIIESIGTKEYEEKLLSVANSLYKNRELLHHHILPFHERHSDSWSPKVEQVGFKFELSGIFVEQADNLDTLWEENTYRRNKIIRRYRKCLKDLNFDSIVIPQGNIQTYEQIKSKVLPMVRRIRQQLRLITNLADDPKIDQIGYIDMQMAIQAIASEGQSNEIFERDEQRRAEEAWVILIDKSASMKLRFDKMAEFTVCISESANELTGKGDAWALYTFDNNFNIIKDFQDKYNQETKARIGSINSGGLSLLPDAIELSSRILSQDPREKKFIFVITDGHPSGYERIHEAFSKTIKKTEMHGITLIGIGVTKAITRKFRNNARGADLKQLVTKFITAYKTATLDV